MGRGGGLWQGQEVIDALHGDPQLGSRLYAVHKVLCHGELGQVQQGQSVEDPGYVQLLALYMNLQGSTAMLASHTASESECVDGLLVSSSVYHIRVLALHMDLQGSTISDNQ